MATDHLLPVWQHAKMVNYLRKWRESRGLTLETVANGLNTDKTQVSKLELGGRKLSTEWLDRFAKFYGIPVQSLFEPPPRNALSRLADTMGLSPKSEVTPAPDVAQNAGSWPKDVPILGVTVGGNNGDFELNTGYNPVDYAKRPPSLFRSSKVFALYVQGSSMSRWREAGQLVYIDPVRPARPGDRVVVECHPEADGEGSHAYLKELVGRTPTKVRLKQYNPETTIEIPTSKVKHIHRVMEWEELLGI